MFGSSSTMRMRMGKTGVPAATPETGIDPLGSPKPYPRHGEIPGFIPFFQLPTGIFRHLRAGKRHYKRCD